MIFYLNVEKLVITIWRKLLLQLPALHQACYRPTRGNQEVLINLGTQDGGKINWEEYEFKQRLRVTRETFNIILDHIREDIKKQPTNLKPFLTTPKQQLGLTLYRLAHGCSFSTVAGLFGVSISLARQTFNKLTRVKLSTSWS